MGDTKVIKKETEGAEVKKETKVSAPRSSRIKMSSGMLFVQATYNNTKVLLTDTKGNAVVSSSSGALGFKGAKKGTPFAAAKVGEIIGDKAKIMGVAEVDVVVCGVGSGRESSIRAFSSRGISINSITDKTPIPHNGPKPKKPRRV